MNVGEAQQLIRRLSFAIEAVLEGSQSDDGWVSPAALNRLWEVYEQDIRPLGDKRIPTIVAEASAEALAAENQFLQDTIQAILQQVFEEWRAGAEFKNMPLAIAARFQLALLERRKQAQ